MMFNERIKQLREDCQIAVALGIDTPMYSEIGRGERSCKVETNFSYLKNNNSTTIKLYCHAKKGIYPVRCCGLF
jgi:LPS O-antigen subunit length determinant protein (WzzB/FepE family)